VIRKELWEHHQFDEYLTGHEDIEWAKHFMDNGYAVVYEPRSCIYHIHDETWKQVYNRFKREAVADVEIGIKNRSDRWHEYRRLPTDILGDVVAAIRQGTFGWQTLSEIVQFRYNQHMGTADGLKSDRNLEAERFEYFYPEANERVVVDESGDSRLDQAPLPEVKPNDVLIRTDYIGVTPEDGKRNGVDLDQSPIIPGKNYVGTVIDLGANANSVDIGDVVVGETKFDCGVCTACSNGREENCHDPILLGRDTDDGVYSRFLAIPSDYVYSLNGDPKDGIVVGTLARTIAGLDRAESLLSADAHCVVIGETPTGEIATQILQRRGYSVERLTNERTEPSHDELIATCALIVDTTGNPETVQTIISRAGSNTNTVLLLLAPEYGGLEISHDSLSNKTIIDVDTRTQADMEQALQLLPELDTDRILDSTYALSEYKSAWEVARTQQTFPIISVNDDDTPEESPVSGQSRP
jgi:D-arabinose 1-dehydrogenase-like Zn-dependent alcohol dehydrogenase